jgi:hypothetical protein
MRFRHLVIDKIWKDPVWSKVISTGIVGLIVFLASIISFKFKTSLIDFFSFKIELWVVLLAIAIFLVVGSLLRSRPVYDENRINVDRGLFNRITKDLEMNFLMAKVKAHNFSTAPVEVEHLTKLMRLLEESNRTDFRFINPKLNRLKNKLIKELEFFECNAGSYLFGTSGHAGKVAIPSEWEYEQPERMKEAFLMLQRNENRLAGAYHDFVSMGKAILRV